MLRTIFVCCYPFWPPPNSTNIFPETASILPIISMHFEKVHQFFNPIMIGYFFQHSNAEHYHF